MNIGQLKAVIAAYCGKAVADFTVNGIDLLLVALNSARLEAEQNNDFVLTQVFADVDVDGLAGVSLSSAKLSGTATAVKIKSIINVGSYGSDGGVYPVTFRSHRSAHSESLELSRSEDVYDDEIRYPSDSDLSSGQRRGSGLVLQGDTLYSYPLGRSGQVTSYRLNAYKWLDDYDADGDTDFMTERAYNYLKWAAIVECNHLVKHFVPREEGNLPPPEKQKESAYRAMQLWDNFIVVT